MLARSRAIDSRNLFPRTFGAVSAAGAYKRAAWMGHIHAVSIREKSLRQRATVAVRPGRDHAIVRHRRAARHVAAAARRPVPSPRRRGAPAPCRVRGAPRRDSACSTSAVARAWRRLARAPRRHVVPRRARGAPRRDRRALAGLDLGVARRGLHALAAQWLRAAPAVLARSRVAAARATRDPAGWAPDLAVPD